MIVSMICDRCVGVCVLQLLDCSCVALQVTRVEFLMFILQHLKIVDRAEMEHILSLFESCDSNGDGVLDLQDIKTRMSCSSRVAASRAASRAASGAGLRPQSSFSRAAASAIAAVEQETSGCRGDVWL